MCDQFCCGRLEFKKQESDSCFVLQAIPDILARHVQAGYLGCRLSYLLTALSNFSYQLSAEVSLVTMPPKRTMESFFTAASERGCQHIENETAVN